MRQLILVATLAALTTAGCKGAPAMPPLVEVVQHGPNTEVDANAEPPDGALKQLASVGVNAAVLLGPQLKLFSGLTRSFYDARGQFRKSSYRLLAVDGWEYRNGWYFRTDNTQDLLIKAHFIHATGLPVSFDVTTAENYGPDMHDNFPADLNSFRLEIDQKLPTGGRMAVTFVAPASEDTGAPIDAFGSGLITLPEPLGNAGFEALNARLTPGGDVERGDLVLKSNNLGATLQFSGEYQQAGLKGNAKLYKNARPVGEVLLVDGKWHVKNSSGSFSLQ